MVVGMLNAFAALASAIDDIVLPRLAFDRLDAERHLRLSIDEDGVMTSSFGLDMRDLLMMGRSGDRQCSVIGGTIFESIT